MLTRKICTCCLFGPVLIKASPSRRAFVRVTTHPTSATFQQRPGPYQRASLQKGKEEKDRFVPSSFTRFRPNHIIILSLAQRQHSARLSLCFNSESSFAYRSRLRSPISQTFPLPALPSATRAHTHTLPTSATMQFNTIVSAAVAVFSLGAVIRARPLPCTDVRIPTTHILSADAYLTSFTSLSVTSSSADRPGPRYAAHTASARATSTSSADEKLTSCPAENKQTQEHSPALVMTETSGHTETSEHIFIKESITRTNAYVGVHQ